MPRTIRFHLDEHVSGAIAKGLRLRGIDVTTTADAGLRSADDTDHLKFAASEGRVVYTNDDDFIVLHNQGVQHAGIAFCKPGSRSIGKVVGALVLIWEILEPDDMRNRVEFI